MRISDWSSDVCSSDLTLYESFDDRPVSAASIAQVHYAIVRDTIEPDDPPADAAAAPIEAEVELREVAVKILRPGIETALARDIDLLYWIAGWVETKQPRLRLQIGNGSGRESVGLYV